MPLLCVPFGHVCDPVDFHILFSKIFTMISSATRLVRNTVWHLPLICSPRPQQALPAGRIDTGFYRQSEQELRAELSARLAKLCNYSGKSARR